MKTFAFSGCRNTILDTPGVIISDMNASSVYVRFAQAPEGLAISDKDLTFARDWTDPDERVYLRKKSMKCAEVLVPGSVPSDYIFGAYVSSEASKVKLNSCGFKQPIEIDSDLFFR